MAKGECTWHSDKRDQVVAEKKAIGVAIFFIFLAYTISVAFKEIKKGHPASKRLTKFIQNTNENSLLFFIAAVGAHMLIPTTFVTIMIWLYMLTLVVQFANVFMEKAVIGQVLNFVQYGLIIVLFFAILIDDWCSYYMYRGDFVNPHFLDKIHFGQKP